MPYFLLNPNVNEKATVSTQNEADAYVAIPLEDAIVEVVKVPYMNSSYTEVVLGSPFPSSRFGWLRITNDD